MFIYKYIQAHTHADVLCYAYLQSWTDEEWMLQYNQVACLNARQMASAI